MYEDDAVLLSGRICGANSEEQLREARSAKRLSLGWLLNKPVMPSTGISF